MRVAALVCLSEQREWDVFDVKERAGRGTSIERGRGVKRGGAGASSGS